MGWNRFLVCNAILQRHCQPFLLCVSVVHSISGIDPWEEPQGCSLSCPVPSSLTVNLVIVRLEHHVRSAHCRQKSWLGRSYPLGAWGGLGMVTRNLSRRLKEEKCHWKQKCLMHEYHKKIDWQGLPASFYYTIDNGSSYTSSLPFLI